MNLTKAEIHYLINENASNTCPEDLHATFGIMRLDGFAINHPYPNPIETDVTGIGNRTMTKQEFKNHYRAYRVYLQTDEDMDPAGGHGLHSHV